MDKYEALMHEIVEFMQGTWLGEYSGHSALRDRGPIRGCSSEDIAEIEAKIGKQLPLAMRAWYRTCGEVPPYLYDHDADFSIRDLGWAQETAVELTTWEECEWKLAVTIIPFSQRLGGQFLFVDVSEGNPDDPAVFHYLEGKPQPTATEESFSTFMREMWLGWLDVPDWGRENVREISSWHEKGYTDWLSRKRVIDELHQEARILRTDLIRRIQQEDESRHQITGPKTFQERWITEFSASETWKKFQRESLRMPFGWTTPPKQNA